MVYRDMKHKNTLKTRNETESSTCQRDKNEKRKKMKYNELNKTR